MKKDSDAAAVFLDVKNFGQARFLILRGWIFKLLQELNLDTCEICKQKVAKVEDLNLNHRIPWRLEPDGVKARELLLDPNNFGCSHQSCNCGDFRRDKNSTGYMGVTKNIYTNKKGENYYSSKIKIDGKYKSLGCFKDPKKTALMWDIGIMKYRNGEGKLNFESLRETYKNYTNKNDWRDFTDEDFSILSAKI